MPTLPEAMTWRVLPARYGLAGFAEPPDADDLALLRGEAPVQVVREGGETTVLAPLAALEACRRRHPSARVEAPLVWIAFEAPMAWDVVGFLARVTGALAEAGVPLGAVCGFSRDHLFVAERYEAAARGVLAELFPEAGSARAD